MKRSNFSRTLQRSLRARRLHNKIRNLELANDKPVLIVNKTNAHIFVQLVDYNKNITIASSSSVQLKLKNGNAENAKLVGIDIAKKMKKLNVSKIIFQKNGSKYIGRIEALANSIRENGIEF
ncbi:50S ribosomal protein L18 [Ureaplasma canigenitalium]|uniref:50S ribosomal protein L18 n=1 Tax=Ureaplasma canigenitalium TaxID=42092 RepID=UPI0004E0EEBA|nr:50S ribosomal protein L18 [Ureaplasma canigenitalium]